MALSYTDLKKGVLFIMNGDPYEVADSYFSRMQQRKAVVQAKVRNLRTGKVVEQSFQPSDQFEHAEIEKRDVTFLFSHRGNYNFTETANPKNPAQKGEARLQSGRRFVLKEETVGEHKKWLKANTKIVALFFKGSLLNLVLPIKMDLKVTEAPPGVQGDRAQSGTKAVTLETGAIIQVPLFINQGDMIRVNTEIGEYVERMEKA